MAELTLKPRKAEYLNVHIGEKTFKIPLAGALTIKELEPLNTPEGTLAFLQKYIDDEETRDSLRRCDYDDITKAWIKESNRAAGKPVGEY